MIDVLQRLAELDSKNPNVVYESATVAECGPEGMMSSEPKTPATLNITAGSGEELGDMLNAIMQLAGVHKVTADELGTEHEPSQLTAAPIMGVGPAHNDNGDMRSMMNVVDKLNPELDGEPEDEGAIGGAVGAAGGAMLGGPVGAALGGAVGGSLEDEGFIGTGVGGVAGSTLGGMAGGALGTAVGGPVGGAIGNAVGSVAGSALGSKVGDKVTGEEYDNTPADPRKPPPFDANQDSYQPNAGGSTHGRGQKNNPHGNPLSHETEKKNDQTMEQRLMSEYKNFLNEIQ